LTTRTLLGFVLLFGFCARAATYKSPLLDHHAWRQADTASISRNFYRERLNLFYPQVDQRGSRQTGYVETGLELFAFVVAIASHAGGFRPEIGRLLSASIFLGTDFLVWRFVTRRYGEETGLLAAALYAFAFPLMLFMERAFMNEALLVFLSVGCLVAAQSYLADGSRALAIALVLLSGLIAAIKLPYLIIWAPIVGLFVEADGLRAARRGWLYVMMAFDLVAAFAWYSHAHALAAETGLTFGLTDKLFDRATVFSTSFPWTLATRLFKDVLGPLGCVGAAAGLWFAYRERRGCEIFGVCGFVAYLLLVAIGNSIHDYYQLAIMPVAPALVALGLHRLSAGAVDPKRRQAVLCGAVAFTVLTTFVRSASAHSWYEYSEEDAELCRRVGELTMPGERIVMMDTSDPSFLFCIDRKGWLLNGADSDRRHLEEARAEGARIAVMPRTPQDDRVRQYLEEHAADLAASRDLRVMRFAD